MSKIVAGLQAEGLIRRRPDPRDRRAVRLEPTARGITLLKQGRRRRVARLAAALAGLTRDELETLARAAALIERIAPRI
jgi:DNA-binding MarR family transcriptional regulator